MIIKSKLTLDKSLEATGLVLEIFRIFGLPEFVYFAGSEFFELEFEETDFTVVSVS